MVSRKLIMFQGGGELSESHEDRSTRDETGVRRRRAEPEVGCRSAIHWREGCWLSRSMAEDLCDNSEVRSV